MEEAITINFDGGSRGNPGVAGIGVVLSAADGTPLITLGKYIGTATNNVAEYTALIAGLREAGKLGANNIIIRGDSELVIKQMRGEYRVKNPGLRELYEQAQQLVRSFAKVTFEHNLRHHNSLADKLANRAMTARGDVTDVDEPIEPIPQEMERYVCGKCGCEIEVRRPCSDPKADGFICRCGTTMK